jgi:hypothetical protein
MIDRVNPFHILPQCLVRKKLGYSADLGAVVK